MDSAPLNSRIEQPDILYHPDEAKWRARTARRLAEDPSLPTTPLPEGFPEVLTGPLVWEGEEWIDHSRWVYHLSEGELLEIDEAVHHFEDLNISLGSVDRVTFPLPKLSQTLYSLAQELYTGRGFFLLRSIPTSRYTPFQNTLIYLGIAKHIAPTLASQDAANGSMLSHIFDAKGSSSSSAYQNVSQPFHTDAGDLVSLFTLGEAAEGGESKIASAWRVYNELAQTRPDLVKVLAEPFPLEMPKRDPPYQLRPFIFRCPGDGRIVISPARRPCTGFEGHPRSASIPPLTEAQAEALDALHFLAKKYCLRMKLQAGDIQYVSNLGLLHCREGFADSLEKTRHLVRLWSRNEELAWPLPPALEKRYKELYKEIPLDQQRFPLESEIRSTSRG